MTPFPPDTAALLASPPVRGRLIVFSGPSGVGKDTVLDRVHELLPDIQRCVTTTTRAPRPGEIHGEDYFFLSMQEFRAAAEADAFLEYAHVNGNFYGTPLAYVEEQRKAGADVLLKIDVQGGLTVHAKAKDAILIFLAPPSLEELERRLRERGTETEEQITRRLLDARSELAHLPQYKYRVVNDTVENAADLVRAILLAERCRVHKSGGSPAR